jgi:site-specific DNA-methyltransferase (adenine-specific)
MDESLIKKQNGNFANTVLGAVPSVVYNEDCVDALKRFEDNYFDLAIVDPPYGIDKKMYRTSMGKCGGGQFGEYSNPNKKRWDKETPTDEYFIELFRVSKNQIIWGGNYFDLPPTRGIICWDKMKQVKNFSQWEMAWTSFDKVALIFKYMWHGNYCGFDQNITLKHTSINLIHPTQKPEPLYDWLLSTYAKKGDKILDTHLGSGSSRISANKAGFDFTGFEIDKDYYEAQEKRFKDFVSQLRMF